MKNTKSTPKKKPAMTAEELLKLIKEMSYDLTSISLELEVPYRTLQNYVYDKRKIPQEFCDKMRLAHKRDRQDMVNMGTRLEHELSIMYPTGIPSEIKNNDHENFY